jgi:hypothetical protein
LARCDSGFYSNSIFNLFDGYNIPFIISARMTRPMKLELLAIKKWVQVDKGIELAELKYKAHDWEKERRVVVVRQNTTIGPKAVGKIHFAEKTVLKMSVHEALQLWGDIQVAYRILELNFKGTYR